MVRASLPASPLLLLPLSHSLCPPPLVRRAADLACGTGSVGVFKNGRVEIIPNDQGNRITPSYVAFTDEGERLIGDAAKNQLTSNPENTVRAWLCGCRSGQLLLPFPPSRCPTVGGVAAAHAGVAYTDLALGPRCGRAGV